MSRAIRDPEGKKRHAAAGVDCGHLYHISERRPVIHWRRDMSGPVRKTMKAPDRRHCDHEAKFAIKVADGLYLAVCGHHSPWNVR